MNLFKTVGCIFLVVGLAMLAAASYLYVDQRGFIAGAKTADGQVIDLLRKRQDDDGSISYTYSAVIRFTDDRAVSHEFVDRVSSSPPRYSKGQEVDLLYAPENPADAIVDDFWGRWAIVVILSGIGAIFSLVGGTLFYREIYKGRTRTWLRENGTAFSVDFLEVERDRSQSLNGRNPYRVVAQGKNPFTGKLEQYLSDSIWVDPTEYMANRKLRVLVDPNKPSRHMLDIDWLSDLIQH
ncbi:DUF3592 domain-containing protein [Parasphingorhabdus flavimaris]|uniref:DUF3592 domain-containing protein n=1 Tax=Parasphingorhabdus flavimaris TaxID=266812 RepID=UPI003002B54E